MAQIVRIVTGKSPFHIIQKSYRKQRLFFEETDYQAYLDLLGQSCREFSIQVWGYCLLPDHVHLILFPNQSSGLRRAIGKVRRLYRRRIIFRMGPQNRLWENSNLSYPLGFDSLPAAVKYIELKPVHANYVKNAADYPWSSARAHLNGEDDGLIKVLPLLKEVSDWKNYLAQQEDAKLVKQFQSQERKRGIFGGLKF